MSTMDETRRRTTKKYCYLAQTTQIVLYARMVITERKHSHHSLPRKTNYSRCAKSSSIQLSKSAKNRK